MSDGVALGGLFICRPAPITYTAGFQQGFSLLSDLHIGARNVDYDLIDEELSQAQKNNDRILINGDIFDAIFPQDRKRYRGDVLHPRIAGKADIINAVVEWGVEILGPYADLIDVIATGNHDEATVRFHNVDILKLLIYELRKLRKNPEHIVHAGGYCGFVDYRMRDSPDNKNRHGKRFVIFYHHGSGGASPVTKGIASFQRKGWVQADVVWEGHRHSLIYTSIQTVGCPLQGDDPVVKDVRHIQTGAYFFTYKSQSQKSWEEHGRIAPYAADWGVAPQSCGGARIVIEFPSTHDNYKVKVIY